MFEATLDNAMENNHFTHSVASSGSDPIFGVSAMDDTGKMAWYYIRVEEQKTDKFKLALKSGHCCLLDYGEILESGYGDMPPEAIKQKMEEEYGITDGDVL